MDPVVRETVDKAIAAVRFAVDRMTGSVPAPSLVGTATGRHYRYREEDPRQAIVLKSVRTLSALLATRTLIDLGLTLDAGATMRILDELGSDIHFLAGPIIFGAGPEKNHLRYLKDFFQEEFDHSDPLKSTQRRDRVPRRDIRAYVARTFHAGMPVSDIVSVTETVEQTFSGYVHGAGVHILESYDGRRFRVPMRPGDDPLEAVRDQFSLYAHRALMSVATAAKAVGDEALFSKLHDLQSELFDEWGGVRPQA